MALLGAVISTNAGAQGLKGLFKKQESKQSSDTVSKKIEKPKGFRSVITKDAKTSKGIITIHMVKESLYLQIPKDLLGKPMLLASRVSATSDNRDVIAGQMPNNPSLIEWTMDNDKVYMSVVNNDGICDQNESIYDGFIRNSLNPISKVFPVKCYSDDSLSVVIDVTKFFCSDDKMISPFIPSSPFDALFGLKRMKGQFKAELSSIIGFKSFEKNFNIKSRLAYSVDGEPFTADVTTSVVLLPNEPMAPRYSDNRVGYFTDSKTIFSLKKDYVQRERYINRWRLEPKPQDVERHKRGELVEPVKPIVYYIDPSFPEPWRRFMKEGVEDWQMAFEKVGFKNAIIAKDYPKDDPDFNPEDIRYSCIVYAPSGTANAMGPSWTDPRSGEIIQGSVYVYHNVTSLLHNWRFIQTSTVDPKAREEVFSMDVMGPLVRYLIAHEIGHTLGLMHNMRGSYAYPVDSLRSPSFTEKHGTTSSIMDYARYNYVAQPGDGVTQLLPPRIGPYDFYAIKFGYAKIYGADTPESEKPVLNEWLMAKCNDPEYKFGEQAIFGLSDPASQTEAIGNDAMKASMYGIKNLKIITDSLLAWTAKDGEDYSYTTKMYKEVQRQFQRYIGHCVIYLGGYYINYSVKGDGQKEFEAVSKSDQKRALKFILENIYNYPSWIKNRELLSHLTVDSDNVSEFQASAMRYLMSPTVLGKLGTIATLSSDPYTQQDYMKDLYNGVWSKTIKGQTLNDNDKTMQYIYVQSLLGSLDILRDAPSKPKSFALNDYSYEMPPFEELCNRDEALQKSMTMQTKEARVRILSKPILYSTLKNLKRLLATASNQGNADSRNHYSYLLSEIERCEKR